MKEYVLKKTTYGGSVSTEIYTNLRKAKSAAWKWINWEKQVIRDRTGERDYQELKVMIVNAYDSTIGAGELIALYE